MKTRAALALVALAASAGGAGASVPDPIAFVRGSQIFAVDPVALVEAQVTGGIGRNRHPRYSPDGTRLLYVSERNDNWDLYISAADGSGEVALTADALWERDVRWSPDGSRAVYSAGGNLWTLDVATGQAEAFTASGGYHSPRFSPNGTQIVAVRNHSPGASSIEVFAVGGAVVRVTPAAGYEFWPSWSPDGSSIVYSRRTRGGYRIRIVSADGGASTLVTSGPGDDIEPLFSPLSNMIAFIRVQDDVGVLFVHDLDALSTTRLTSSVDGGVAGFTWSPDGTQLAFTRYRDGERPNLFVVGVDGSGLRRLTATGAGEIQVDWGGPP